MPLERKAGLGKDDGLHEFGGWSGTCMLPSQMGGQVCGVAPC